MSASGRLVTIIACLIVAVSRAAPAQPAPTTGDRAQTRRDASPASAPATQPAGDATVLEWPDTPGARCAAAFFDAFNAGDDERARDFERRFRAASALEQRPVAERVEQMRAMHDSLGTLSPTRIVASGPGELSVLARASRQDGDWLVTFSLEDRAPNGLVSASIRGPVRPEEVASESTPVSAEFRTEMIAQVAKALRETYVDPNVGARAAQALVDRDAEGRYRDLVEAGALAARLTADMREICKDVHLSMEASHGRPLRSACGPASDGDDAERASWGYGFAKVERLPGNIGYVKFDGFDPSPRAEEIAAAALAFVQDCDALIFDLRENHGGSPKMIRFLLSYLFDKPTHLNSFYDRQGNQTAETWTMESVPGKRFAAEVPVYVLTSGLTVSAAEEFTYDLQSLGRATIVGEATAGGAHLVMNMTFGGSFVLHLPYARACNPVTKKNWEGVGVKPDLPARAADALDAACKDAGKRLRGQG